MMAAWVGGGCQTGSQWGWGKGQGGRLGILYFFFLCAKPGIFGAFGSNMENLD